MMMNQTNNLKSKYMARYLLVNIKRLFTLIMLLILVGHVQAKTIHWLTFFDTRDNDVGKIDENTRNLLRSKWIDVVNAVLKENGYSINSVDIYDKELSPDTCKAIVENVQLSADDIVVFYYAGHGTQNNGHSDFPLLCLGQKREIKCLPLSWIHNTLIARKPRLTITIGMCCNSRQPQVEGTYAPRFGLSFDSGAIITSEQEEAIRKMFLNYTGDLIITSASPMERSFAVLTTNTEASDYFSLNLISKFENIKVSNGEPSWDTLLKDIREGVSKEVQNDKIIQQVYKGATQTPLWNTNLVKAKAPEATKLQEPVTFSAVLDKDYEIKSKINNLLSYISSANVEVKLRRHKALKSEELFVKDLTVKILPEYGDKVIDKEHIGNYLKRISTSPRIAHSSVVDFKLNEAGKVCELSVREIIKQR
jgi:hypothetical protein